MKSVLTKKQWAAEKSQEIATGSLLAGILGGILFSLIALGIGMVEGYLIQAFGMCILGGLVGGVGGFLGGMLVIGLAVKQAAKKIEFREEDGE